MFIRSLFLATSFILLLACTVADPSLGATRDRILWNKTGNYQVLQYSSKRRLSTAPKEHPRALRSKAPVFAEPSAPKILATFEYNDTTLWTGSPDQSFMVSKPQPTRCEWARSIVKGYAFDNVEPKKCEGSILSFEAIRSGQKFQIEVSALNGDLISVEKIRADGIHAGN